MSVFFERHDLGPPAQARMQLAAPDIDGIDAPRAAREQHLGEAAGRGADIEADAARRIDAEMVERGRELHAAARDPGMRRRGAQRRIGGDLVRRLCAPVTPSAVTRPAAIAACALARLSNRPRSTSSRSARMRVVMTVP